MNSIEYIHDQEEQFINLLDEKRRNLNDVNGGFGFRSELEYDPSKKTRYFKEICPMESLMYRITITDKVTTVFSVRSMTAKSSLPFVKN